MKILYVDMEYDYGVESRGPNVIGQDGFKKSFEKLGHSVVPFYYDKYLSDLPALQSDLKDIADSECPDLIFFSLFTHQFSIETLDDLKSKYTTVNWFGDDQWRFDGFTSRYATHFSYCVTTDKFSVPKYKKIGQRNVIYSQWAAIDSHKVPAFAGYKYDVSFVGGFHPYRKWFIDTLIKRGINVAAFGHGWKNGALTPAQMNEVFVSSKINLNIGNSSSFDARYLIGHWRALPNLLRSAKNSSQIKARNFEIPFFGGFQLTDYVPTIEEYFHIGREIVCYRDIGEAYSLIRYYLSNDGEREHIAKEGYRRAVQEHGYLNRIKDFLEQVK